jgi:hypothetical protein
MSPANHRRGEWRTAAFVGAALCGVLLIVAALFVPRAAAAGWLIGFTFWTQILVGSLTLIMIHRLTGGRWGEIAAPAIEPAAAAVPLLCLLAVPLFVSAGSLYSWSQHSLALKADVLAYYLNLPSFIVRTLVALLGWSALALFLPRVRGRSGLFLAALGLAFHALIISSVSIDWYLSLEAPFTSSSFGASVAISSLVGALALATLPPSRADNPAIGDIGGLLLAAILGITYIDFMAVLVIWYGDLPNEEIWFVERNQWPWALLAIVSFLLVSLLPTLALLLSQVRNARGPLRAIGTCVLAGLACYDAYLIAPPSGSLALATGFIAIAGIGLLLFGLFASGADSLVWSRGAADAR